MLKEFATSSATKLIAACVCPIAGTAALTVGVPKVRQAVHRATAPVARAKPRVRVRQAPAAAPAIQTALVCPPDTPVLLAGSSIAPLIDNPAFDLASGGGGDGGGGFNPGFGGGTLPGGGGGTNFPIGGGGGFPGNPGGPSVTPGIPEPSVWLQLIVGFGVVGGATRVTYRQQKKLRDTAAG